MVRTQTSEKPLIQAIDDPEGGDTYILAPDEATALDEARCMDTEADVKVEAVGWMHKVQFPDGYNDREEWEESPAFCDWWEGCQAPVNDAQRAHIGKSLSKAWRVISR